MTNLHVCYDISRFTKAISNDYSFYTCLLLKDYKNHRNDAGNAGVLQDYLKNMKFYFNIIAIDVLWLMKPV